jgi:spore coat protein CotH
MPLLTRLCALVLVLVNAGLQAGCEDSANSEGYAELFDGSSVRRIDIQISPERYAEAESDLQQVLCCGLPGPDNDPVWIPAQVTYGGRTWSEAAFRFKGNSSLQIPYEAGSRKLPFRLNFKKLSPSNELFHGFAKMTFANGFHDPTLIRERLMADILGEAGVPTARMAFVQVYVDRGEGPTFWGLYTMIEDPTDLMMDRVFGDGEGNLYKPDGDFADWSGFSEATFRKKSNKAENDYSDIQAAIAAVQDSRGNSAEWRAGVEDNFDMHGFLTAFAVNQTLVNWDSYGWMRHNYYLYGDPDDGGRLHYIPWDFNEAMAAPRASGAELVMADQVGSSWPLIRYALDDQEYRDFYRQELARVAAGAFESGRVSARIAEYRRQVEPFVTGAEAEEWPYRLSNPEGFEAAFAELQDHIDGRHQTVGAALGSVD